MPPLDPQRNIQLDGLRGLAILAVMVSHFVPREILAFAPGWVGVHLFFVLSGFLITGILLRARELAQSRAQSSFFTLRQFYIRRFVRIAPIFFLTLFLLTLGNVGDVRRHFFWHLGYLSNFRFALDGYFHDWVAHFWTLCVEEQFYLLWPAVIFLIPTRMLLPIVFIFIIAGPSYRYAALFLQLPNIAHQILPMASVDALAMGALLAVLLYQKKLSPQWRSSYIIIAWIGAISILVDELLPANIAIIERCVWSPFGISLLALGLIGQTLGNNAGILRRILEFQPLIFTGAISYGLYIYHAILQGFIEHTIKPKFVLPLVFELVILFVGSFVLAVSSWYLLEKPLNSFKHLFPYLRPENGARSWWIIARRPRIDA